MLLTNLIINTVSSSIIENGFIQIQDDKITSVGFMKDVPTQDHIIIDCNNLIAFPGLVDAHTHIGMFGDSLGFEGDDGNESTDPITPHIRAIDAINMMDRCFVEALEYGVTTVVVSPGSANPVSGQIVAIKTTGKRVDKSTINPFIGMKFAMGENPKNVYSERTQTPITRMGIAGIIREHLMKAQRYSQQITASLEDSELEEPDYDIKLDSFVEIFKHKISGFFHAHRADDIFTALRIAEEFDIKPILVHCTDGYLVADEIALAKIPVICGPMIGNRSKPELKNLNRKNPSILSKAGVKVAICTDHPEVPQEFLMLSASIAHFEGMDKQQAIRAITLTPAEICGIADRVGSIEVGKDADIILYDRCPLSNLAKPIRIFVNGLEKVLNNN